MGVGASAFKHENASQFGHWARQLRREDKSSSSLSFVRPMHVRSL